MLRFFFFFYLLAILMLKTLFAEPTVKPIQDVYRVYVSGTGIHTVNPIYIDVAIQVNVVANKTCPKYAWYSGFILNPSTIVDVCARPRHYRVHRVVQVQRVGNRVVRAQADDVAQHLLAVRKVRDAQEHQLHVHHQHQQKRVYGAPTAGTQPVVAHARRQPVHQRPPLPRERPGYPQPLIGVLRRYLRACDIYVQFYRIHKPYVDVCDIMIITMCLFISRCTHIKSIE